MLPLVSEALAVMVSVEPTVKLVPLAGLVMVTTGGVPVAVPVTGLEVTETPLASTALAVKV